MVDQFIDIANSLQKSIKLFTEEALQFPQALRTQKPSATAFSATEIVYHMLDVEKLWQYRFDGLLDGSRTTFEAMNPDQVALESNYNSKSYEDGIAALLDLRKKTIALVSHLTPEQSQLSGIHSRYGEMNIMKILETMHNHDLTHKAQLERTLKQLQEVATV